MYSNIFSHGITLARNNLILGDLALELLVDEHRLQALVVGEAIAEDQAIDGVRAQARDQRAQVGAISDAGVCERLDEILHIQALGRADDGVHNDGRVATCGRVHADDARVHADVGDDITKVLEDVLEQQSEVALNVVQVDVSARDTSIQGDDQLHWQAVDGLGANVLLVPLELVHIVHAIVLVALDLEAGQRIHLLVVVVRLIVAHALAAAIIVLLVRVIVLVVVLGLAALAVLVVAVIRSPGLAVAVGAIAVLAAAIAGLVPPLIAVIVIAVSPLRLLGGLVDLALTANVTSISVGASLNLYFYRGLEVLRQQ
jgi:hypothetical protein